jgi:hypothetical protein
MDSSTNNTNTTSASTSTSTSTNNTNQVSSMYNTMNNALINPSIIIILGIVVILYLVLFTSITDSTSSSSSASSSSSYTSSSVGESSSNIFGILFVAVLVVLVIINGFQYIFGVSIFASISDFFSATPKVDINVVDGSRLAPTVVPEIKLAKQVFNIPENDYIYGDAKALCKAYGAELATYEQVEDAYNKGGEWCNYGWSEGQMALFPTQQKTFDKLQTIEGHEHDCGRPGVNGGYIANPEMKFGVNCYGYKPKITKDEEYLMANAQPYPKTNKDILLEKRVEYWKNKLGEVLVSPFNHNTWSRL